MVHVKLSLAVLRHSCWEDGEVVKAGDCAYALISALPPGQACAHRDQGFEWLGKEKGSSGVGVPLPGGGAVSPATK